MRGWWLTICAMGFVTEDKFRDFLTFAQQWCNCLLDCNDIVDVCYVSRVSVGDSNGDTLWLNLCKLGNSYYCLECESVE